MFNTKRSRSLLISKLTRICRLGKNPKHDLRKVHLNHHIRALRTWNLHCQRTISLVPPTQDRSSYNVYKSKLQFREGCQKFWELGGAGITTLLRCWKENFPQKTMHSFYLDVIKIYKKLGRDVRKHTIFLGCHCHARSLHLPRFSEPEENGFSIVLIFPPTLKRRHSGRRGKVRDR